MEANLPTSRVVSLNIFFAFVFAFTAVGFASLTFGAAVPSSGQGFVIQTSTSIECIGTVTESTSYNHTYYNASEGGPNTLGEGYNSGAEVAYSKDFQALNGYTQYVSGFRADSVSAPNLETDVAIGYEADADSVLAEASFNEKVGLTNISAGGAAAGLLGGLLDLCPVGPAGANGEYGASSQAVAAGSAFRVTSLRNFTTASAVSSTEDPGLFYGVSAAVQDGSFAGVGEIVAAFYVRLIEGATPFDGQTPVPIISDTNLESIIRAEGRWNFNQEYRFLAVDPALGTPRPFVQLPVF